MSRPKPTVLLQHSNKSTFKMDEVLAAEGIWAVFYDGKPLNLQSSSLVANYNTSLIASSYVYHIVARSCRTHREQIIHFINQRFV